MLGLLLLKRLLKYVFKALYFIKGRLCGCWFRGAFDMKHILLLVSFLFLTVFIWSCENTPTNKEGGHTPFVETEEDRQKLINRLTKGRTPLVINAEIEDRYKGGSDYELDYDGPACKESVECVDRCRRLVSSSRRRQCEKEPAPLVEAIEKAIVGLLSLDDPESESAPIDAGLFQVIFRLDRSLIPNLLKRDHMTEGDLRMFLAWIALNQDVARVLYQENRSGSILRDSFRKLGEAQENRQKSQLIAGLNSGLIKREDTFLALAADRENEEGFIMAHNVVYSACSSTQCRLEIYCARENFSGRSFRSRRDQESCRTPGDDRRYSRNRLCYVHGGLTWSYLSDLIEEEEIRISNGDLKDALLKLNVDNCNKACGDADNTQCDAV